MVQTIAMFKVSTITEVHGRLSQPTLELSSHPAIYAKEELLAFLLGGEPAPGRSEAIGTRQPIASAGAGYVANLLGRYVREALPVNIDALGYRPGGPTTSPLVTVGKWVTDELFVAYRHRLSAHPDENTSEAHIESSIRQRLSLAAVIGDSGYQSLDLLWRHHW